MFSAFDELIMRRCFDLARQGSKFTKYNPLVGAVIVHDERIIGEGYHKAFGGPHAEVNAINSVKTEDKEFLTESTLYVSLEPCCHEGKTGACTTAISKLAIPKVKVSCLDPTPKVNGKGIQLLKEAGIDVQTGLLEKQGQILLKKFVANQMHNRPYIILKLVESADGFMGRKGEQVWISNEASKMLSHKWRSEVDAIMVGTNTAITDDPSLTNRLYPGENPMRIIVDHNERLPKELKVLSDEHPTLVISSQKSYDFQKLSNKEHIHVEKKDSLEVFLQKLYDKSLYSIIIEGGPKLLKSFYQNKLWDECRVIRSKKKLENGIKSPVFMLKYDRKYDIDGDQCIIAYNDLL